MTAFVPKDFEVPAGFETPGLPGAHARHFGRREGLRRGDDQRRTPSKGVQSGGAVAQRPEFEQDLIDLGWHHKEFQQRRSFAYTVMSLDEAACLGCLYIEPTKLRGYDAEAHCWVRTSHAETLDARLYRAPAGLDRIALALQSRRLSRPVAELGPGGCAAADCISA